MHFFAAKSSWVGAAAQWPWKRECRGAEKPEGLSCSPCHCRNRPRWIHILNFKMHFCQPCFSCCLLEINVRFYWLLVLGERVGEAAQQNEDQRKEAMVNIFYFSLHAWYYVLYIYNQVLFVKSSIKFQVKAHWNQTNNNLLTKNISEMRNTHCLIYFVPHKPHNPKE